MPHLSFISGTKLKMKRLKMSLGLEFQASPISPHEAYVYNFTLKNMCEGVYLKETEL